MSCVHTVTGSRQGHCKVHQEFYIVINLEDAGRKHMYDPFFL
jgi:hypothetical protein